MPRTEKQVTVHAAQSGWIVRVADGSSTQSFSCPSEQVAFRLAAIFDGTKDGAAA